MWKADQNDELHFRTLKFNSQPQLEQYNIGNGRKVSHHSLVTRLQPGDLQLCYSRWTVLRSMGINPSR